MVVSSFATANDATSVVPVIDVGRLREIMESVRRMSEGNENRNDGKQEGNVPQNMQEQVTAKDVTITAVFEPESDIASSRSQSPTSREDKQRSMKGSLTVSNVNGAAHISASSELTPEDLYRAKVLVLDLLGWGVPPEYILQRGVSHALLCSIFADLKLRLPETIEADYAAIQTTNGHHSP